MRKYMKRATIITAAALTILAASGAAAAYWTAPGTGTGTGTTGEGGTITVNQTSVLTPIAPGAPAQELKGNFTVTGDGAVHINGITATIATDKPGCDASDFLLSAPSSVTQDIPVGANVGAWSGGSIQFNNKPNENQDDCKGAAVTIRYLTN